MRVQLVDPSAFTPPYDRSLAAALARAGVDVELVTSRFLYGTVPPAEGYEVKELFYRRASARGLGARGRRLRKLGEHVLDMLRYRRHAETADLVHWQWLSVEQLDAWLLAPRRPRVLTAHNVVAHERRPGQAAARRRVLRAMDAVVVHSEHGRDQAVGLGTDPARVHVIPHGAFDYLTRQEGELPLPAELAAVDGPVVLFFGLIRDYKGVDVLLRAWREVPDAELWVVGMPRVDMAPLRALAPERVRFVPRFVSDLELPAYFRRADLVVLPYRDADQSGVLYTALAFGKPLVLSDVGGFGEVAAHGAARLVPPGDEGALAGALRDLLAEPQARARLAENARRAAAGPYSWDSVARRTLALYRELLDA
ncbi:MAG TPA: glycosyltransferase family 4 protein [Thermoleophilaceae bacterium]